MALSIPEHQIKVKHITEEEKRRQIIKTKMELESQFYNAYERLKNCRDNGCRLDNTVDEYIDYLCNAYQIYDEPSSLILDNSKKEANNWTKIFMDYILKVGDNYKIHDIIFSKEQIESIIHKHFILQYFKNKFQIILNEDKNIFKKAMQLYEQKLRRNTIGKNVIYVDSGKKNVPINMRTHRALRPEEYVRHKLRLISNSTHSVYNLFNPDTAPSDFRGIHKLLTSYKRRKHPVFAYNIYGGPGVRSANSAGLKWKNNERDIYGNIRWHGSSRSHKTRKNKRN
jgi:hypothetical protein